MTSPGLTNHRHEANAGQRQPFSVGRWWWMLSACLIFGLTGRCPAPVSGQVPQDLPWYDADHDSVQPVDLSLRKGADSLDRADIPLVMPKKGTANRGMGSSPLTNSGSWVSVVIWMVFGVLLAVLVIALLWAFFRAESRRYDATAGSRRRSMEESILQLPFELESSGGDFRSLAEQAYRAGDLRKAVIYLFSHVLVSLDQSNRVRLKKGKTNRQYLQELQSSPQLADYYRRVMIPFEETFFGDRAVDPGHFDQCWNQLDQFHARLEAPVGLESNA